MWWSLAIGCTSPVVSVDIEDGPHVVLEKRLTVVHEADEPLILECAAPEDPEERHVLDVPSGDRVALRGLLASTTYRCELRLGRRVVWGEDVQTEALPEGLADLVLAARREDAVLAGRYVLTNHWRQGAGARARHRAVIYDPAGRVRWYRSLPEAQDGGIAVDWTGSHVLVGGGDGLAPTLFDLSGEPVFRVGPPVEGFTHHHEAAHTPEGWVVSLSGAPLDLPGFDPADEGFDVELEGFVVEATDPRTGIVEWRWDAQEAADRGELDWIEVHRENFLHINALAWVDDALGPAVWASSRNQDRLFRIDRRTGEVGFPMGGLENPFRVVDERGQELGPEGSFYNQHGHEWQGDRLRLFDNGSGQSGRSGSRAVEYDVDLEARTLVQRWSWTEPGLREPFYGSVRGLPGGRRLVASGHCARCETGGGEDRAGFVAEVDAQGEVAWRLQLPDATHSLYRATSVDGCALFANARYCPAITPR